MHWTPEEVRWLRQAIADGKSREEIVERLGREDYPVRRKASRLGLALPRLPRKDKGATWDRRVLEQSNASIVRSTKMLGEAINALIDRMPANDVAEMLGKPHLVIPGTERVLKTCAVERMAA